MRLLVVEDDDRSASYLVRGLTESGHVVDRAADGELGLALALEGIYDALIVDRRLPLLDGLSLIRQLREHDANIPILVLSAIGGTADRIRGMREGCDDYLAKPYAFAEVLARLDALIRRRDRARSTPMVQTGAVQAGVLRVGDLAVDMLARSAARNGQVIRLQHRELLLLAYLMRHAGQVVTRSMLLEAAWTYDFEPRGNIIDMHVHRLRQKIDQGFDHPLIHTIAGAGYMIADLSAVSILSGTAPDGAKPS